MTYRLDGNEKESFLIRIADKEGKKIEVHTRKVKWDSDPDSPFYERSYEYGINTKCETIDDAFDLMEECAVNLTQCGKSSKSIYFENCKVGRIHHDDEWVCYTRERNECTSKVLSHHNLNTLDEAFEKLNEEICF